jgi:NitT/TauT family transport system permease protein
MSFRNYSAVLMPILASLVIVGVWHGIGFRMEKQRVADGYSMEEAEGSRRAVLPVPEEIIRAIVDERLTLIKATTNTFSAALFGFLAAVGIGYTVSMLFASSRLLKQAAYPWILVLQMTPVIVLAPIIAIWMGPGLAATSMITFLIGFFPVIANSTQGLISTDKNLLDLFAVCKASKTQEILLLRVPYSIPYFLTGMKIAGTLAPIGAITGDLFAGTSQSGGAGLGFMALSYISSAKIPALFATAALACAMGFVFVGGVNFIHWLALRNWHDSMVKLKK